MLICLCLSMCVQCDDSRCGRLLILCGWFVVYTISTHNVAGLMHHIVLQQRVTLDCALNSLSLAGLLPHTTHRRYEHTHNIIVLEIYAVLLHVVALMHVLFFCMHTHASISVIKCNSGVS